MADRIRITPEDLVRWTEVVPLAKLRPHPKNARLGDVERIRGSLAMHGQFRAIIVSADYVVLAGNHTYFAEMERQPGGNFAVHHLPIPSTHPQALEILAAENGSQDEASYDRGLLALLLAEVKEEQGTVDGTTYTDDFLARLIEEQRQNSILEELTAEPDSVPPPPSDPVTRPRDTWVLGRHLLHCGDATDVESYERLLADTRPDVVFTDPGYSEELGPDASSDLLRAALGATLSFTRPATSWYVCAPPGPGFLAFGNVLVELEVLRQTLVWVKDSFVLGRGDYHYQHEPLLYGWTPGFAHDPLEDRSQSSTWFFDRPTKNPLHPTQKPVDLVERALRNSGGRDAIVLDPFAGSGTTMVAAQILGMRARMLEIDPAMCDVIAQRFQELVGAQPVLLETGQPHNFIVEDATDGHRSTRDARQAVPS